MRGLRKGCRIGSNWAGLLVADTTLGLHPGFAVRRAVVSEMDPDVVDQAFEHGLRHAIHELQGRIVGGQAFQGTEHGSRLLADLGLGREVGRQQILLPAEPVAGAMADQPRQRASTDVVGVVRRHVVRLHQVQMDQRGHEHGRAMGGQGHLRVDRHRGAAWWHRQHRAGRKAGEGRRVLQKVVVDPVGQRRLRAFPALGFTHSAHRHGRRERLAEHAVPLEFAAAALVIHVVSSGSKVGMDPIEASGPTQPSTDSGKPGLEG